MKVYHDEEIDGSILDGKKVAVIGYGSQGRAQALNMKESGVDVVVGLRPGKSWDRAVEDGQNVMTVIEAAQAADVVLMLIPDMVQKAVYNEEIALAMGPGKALQFAHGFNIHFKQIEPSEDIDVIMVAPKSPGPELRRQSRPGEGPRHREGPRLRQSRGHRDDLQGRDRERPLRGAGGPLRGGRPAHQEGLQGAHGRWVPA
jgi:ketol-acid reductoisomerase